MDLKALLKISCGVYVLTSGNKTQCNGFITSSVVQVSPENPLVIVSVNKQDCTCEPIRQKGTFVVSVLSQETPLSFIESIGFDSGKDFDKLKDLECKVGTTGIKIALNHAVAYFEAKVVNEIDAKTHTIFVGEIFDAELLNDKPPMTYEFYLKTKKDAKAYGTFGEKDAPLMSNYFKGNFTTYPIPCTYTPG